VKYEYGEPWWNDIDRLILLIRPPELSRHSLSSHLVANQEELGEGNDKFGLRNIFVQNSIKSSWAISRVRRIKETDVSRTISVLIIRDVI
jgi:hypothetical protein